MDPVPYDQQGQQQPPPVAPAAQAQPRAQIQTTPPQSSEAIPVQPTQNMNVLPLTPVKRGGLAGIIDDFRDALAGPAPGKIFQDAEGNQFVQHPDSNGSKWMRVIGKTIAGAAAGLANGRGAGNEGKAMLAGVNEGEHIADRQKASDQSLNEQARQAQLDKFNTIKLQHDLAAQNFEMTRREIGATREDMQYAQDQLARELKPQDQGGYGSIDAGVYPDHLALADIQKIHPDFWKRVYTADPNADSDVRQYPEFDADGKRVGIHVVIRTHDASKEMAPEDAMFAHYVPDPKGVGPGKIEWVKPSGAVTNGQIETWSNAAFKAQNADLINFKKLQDTQAQIDQRESSADKNERPRAKKGGAGKAPATPAAAGSDDNLLRMIGTGQMGIGNWSYVLSRMKDPDFMKTLTNRYPDMDASRIKSYMTQYEHFTSGKVADQLNRGATALDHLNELYNLDSAKAAIPLSEERGKLNTLRGGVVGELGQFYAESTIPGQARFEKGIGSEIPWQRQAAIVQQVQMMGDKWLNLQQQWEDALPSKQYRQPMPTITPQSLAVWKRFDPVKEGIFEQRQKAMTPQAPNQAQQQGVPPQGATKKVPGPDGRIHWTNDQGTVDLGIAQ